MQSVQITKNTKRCGFLDTLCVARVLKLLRIYHSTYYEFSKRFFNFGRAAHNKIVSPIQQYEYLVPYCTVYMCCIVYGFPIYVHVFLYAHTKLKQVSKLWECVCNVHVCFLENVYFACSSSSYESAFVIVMCIQMQQYGVQ